MGACLPVIDFRKLEKPGSGEWDSVRSQVWKASQDYGCFRVVFSPTVIPLEIPQEIMRGMEELFHLPLETLLNNVSDEPFGGYIGKSEFAPLFESVAMVHPDDPRRVEAFVSLFWPGGNPCFSKTTKSFAEEATKLDRTIWRMIMESMELEKYIEQHKESVIFSMRGIRYEAPWPVADDAEITSSNCVDDDNAQKMGLGSHMDQGLTAILYGNHVHGLEVETKDGQWFAVDYSDDSFIIILGESFHAWTNGRVYSPYHRVRLNGKETRTKYTFGMFSGFTQGYTVKAPEEAVDGDHPLLYKPFDFNKFLEVRLEETKKAYNSASIANYSPIKTYFAA